MKRMFVLMICVVMIFAIAACGEVNSDDIQSINGNSATTNTQDDVTSDNTEVTTNPTENEDVTTIPTQPENDSTQPTTNENQKPETEENDNNQGNISTETTKPPVIVIPSDKPEDVVPPVSEDTKPDTTVKTTGISISVTTIKLFVDEKATVAATVKPSNATDKSVVWTSSNPSVATVNNGVITALKVGNARITAKASGGQSTYCDVVVSKKTTTPTEPPATEPPATEPPATEPAVPTVKEKKYTGYEIVSVSSPEQALLTRFYGGANKAFLKNDSMTIQINMSNGKATEEDLSVELPYGCSYSISGNRITFVFDGSKSYGGGKIVVKNSDGTKNEIPIDVTVIRVASLSSNTAELKNQFVKYGNKRGLTFIPNGTDFALKYNGGYTKDDKTKSITGCTIVGTDDYISSSNNPNWIYEALDLVDEYNNRGFNKWNFYINAYSFTTLAE